MYEIQDASFEDLLLQDNSHNFSPPIMEDFYNLKFAS